MQKELGRMLLKLLGLGLVLLGLLVSKKDFILRRLLRRGNK